MFSRTDHPQTRTGFVVLAAAVVLLCAPSVDSAHAAAGKARPKKAPDTLPVRGIHLSAPAKRDLQVALDFIRNALPKEGVNTLILEFNYEFDYQSRPEFANPRALNKADVEQIAAACRANNIELIPQINCLGHQSWSKNTGKLLRLHPEFDETPGKYPENKDIYCRSYCPLHPDVHKVLFDLMDELASACSAKSFHVGMDEVFILADPDCPRCKGKDPADLFAGEVKLLRDHLQSRGCRMWMWGDRFLDAKTTGLGRWEAADNGTAPAIDRVPKDIVICDWHYEKAPDTPRYFAGKGFDVVACPWRKSNVALDQLALIRAIRSDADKAVAARALGMVQTTWCGFGTFVQAYNAAAAGGQSPAKGNAAEAAQCFRTLFAAIRQPNAK
ncbi:MAG: family 20 glycosylhydrolase [Candidatus Sumerlaeia bacterium]|nr:family 20 glycosylhydrolase [Candidatus Sumerlaeia bacterium]